MLYSALIDGVNSISTGFDSLIPLKWIQSVLVTGDHILASPVGMCH